MSYLARLKAEVFGKRQPSEPTKPTKAPSVSFVSAPSRLVSEIEGDCDAARPGAMAREAGNDLIRPTSANQRIETLAGKHDPDPKLFTLSPPGDPANDDEALRERVAIMMEGNGWDEATALWEARCEADRERSWRGFLLNAQRILDAPQAQQEALFRRYRREARERYGEAAAANMATTMIAWIAGRGLH